MGRAEIKTTLDTRHETTRANTQTPPVPVRAVCYNRIVAHETGGGKKMADEGGALPITAFDALAILAAVYLVARLVGYIGSHLFGGDRPREKAA